MTWVKPSKPAVIFIRDICYRLFEEMERLQPGESIVMNTCESLRRSGP
jgi:hypothetical protein